MSAAHELAELTGLKAATVGLVSSALILKV
jgi:hypothetical protein